MVNRLTAKNLRWLSVLLVFVMALACFTVPALAEEPKDVPVNNYSSFAPLENINIMNYVTDVKMITNPGTKDEKVYKPGNQMSAEEAITTGDLVRFEFYVDLTGAEYIGVMRDDLDVENSHKVLYKNSSKTYVYGSARTFQKNTVQILDDSDITRQYTTPGTANHVFLQMEWLEQIAQSTKKVDNYKDLSVKYDANAHRAYIYWPDEFPKQPVAERGSFYVDVYLNEGEFSIKLPGADEKLLPGLDKDTFDIIVKNGESSGSDFNYTTNYEVIKNWVGFSRVWKDDSGKDKPVEVQFTMNLEGGHTYHMTKKSGASFKLLPAYPDDSDVSGKRYKLLSIDVAENTKGYENFVGTVVDPYDEEYSWTFTNTEMTKLLISKSITNGPSKVAGAELAIYRKGENEPFKTWTSESGKAQEIVDILPGDYVIRETKAPDIGVLLDKDVNFSVVAEDGTYIVVVAKDSRDVLKYSGNPQDGFQLELMNQFDTAKVNISKSIVGGASEVEGAHLVLKDAAGKTVEQWDSEKGKSHLIEVLPGSYRLEETIAPKGCEKLSSAIDFTVDENLNVTTNSADCDVSKAPAGKHDYDMTVWNYPERTDIRISKSIIGVGDEVEGATMVLQEVDGRPIKEWTSEKGKSMEIRVLPGNYTLTETQAPEGCVKLETAIRFTITEDFKITDVNVDGKVCKISDGNKDKGFDIVVYNELTEVPISKVDATNGKEIPGAHLAVTKKGETTPFEEWVSKEDETHVIKGLPSGTWVLTETTAPDGFEVAESIEFVVDENGKVVGDKIVMKDEHIKIYISKKNLEDKRTDLVGATLQIVDGETVVMEWETDGRAKEISIPVGFVNGNDRTPVKFDHTYKLVEKKAPSGFQKAADIEFTVDGRGVVSTSGNNTLTMYDAPSEAVISKVDATNGKEIPGAHLIVTKGADTIDEWISEEDKVHVIKNLPAGTYTLTEITAPDGYEIAESIDFVVDENGEVKEPVVMQDKPITLEISKKIINGTDELPGALLQIKDGDKVLQEWTSGRAPKSISVSFVDKEGNASAIKVGKEYTLVEITAPAGYLVAEEIKFCVDEHGEVSVNGADPKGEKITMFDDYTRVVISKRDSKSGKELKNAILEVRDASGNVVWTNAEFENKVGPYAVNALVPGAYTLVEVKAPSGYKLAEPIAFNVRGDGVAVEVVMLDEKKPTPPSEPDDPTPTPVPGKPITPVRPLSPKTGDNAGMIGMLAVASAITLAGVSIKRKKEM